MVLLAFVGCSSGDDTTDSVAQSVSQCKEQYSVQNGYGAASDPPTCTSPPPPAPEPVCEPATPESVALECSAAGVSCDPNTFITREAAECVGRLAGLQAGIEPWSVSLLFAYDARRPMWVIRNVTSRDPSNCSMDGESLRVDAVTGETEAIETWGAIC